MDPISQAVVGAAVSQSFATKSKVRVASFCGIMGGLAPDLDIVISSSTDPLLAIEYHRHFTHALFFIPFGGFIVAYALWNLFFKKTQSFRLIFLFTSLGFATHGLLDACTSYGTLLFWPVSNYRVTWNLISIIDPIFTVSLIILCLLSVSRRAPSLAKIACVFGLAYLAYGFYNQQRVASVIEEIAVGRQHQIERIFLNPTIGNNLLWRSVYQANGKYYIDAVHVAPFASPIHQEGSIVSVIDKETIFPSLRDDSVQRQDIRRFAYFSKDFIYIHPEYPDIIADLRYGTLPYDDRSLWGIQVNENTPDTHVVFGNLRNFSDKHWDEFWLMLQGKFSTKKDALK